MEKMKYLELLIKMDANGYNCKREITETLKALHIEMGFKKDVEVEKKFVMVFEKDFEGVIKSAETFKSLMGSNVQISRGKGDDQELRLGNTRVMIVKVKSNVTDLDRFRGYSPDYIINNSDVSIQFLGLGNR